MDLGAERGVASALTAESRAFCGGQDTSQLYERTDGKKAWRAEVPATEEEKEAAIAAEREFVALFPLEYAGSISSSEILSTDSVR